MIIISNHKLKYKIKIHSAVNFDNNIDLTHYKCYTVNAIKKQGDEKMKTVIKITAVIMVLATVVVLFTSCGNTLNGTYKPADGVGSLTFDKDGNVKGELFGITMSGTYSIDKDEIRFEKETILGIGGTLTYSFEKSGKTIIIDGKEYVKE